MKTLLVHAMVSASFPSSSSRVLSLCPCLLRFSSTSILWSSASRLLSSSMRLSICLCLHFCKIRASGGLVLAINRGGLTYCSSFLLWSLCLVNLLPWFLLGFTLLTGAFLYELFLTLSSSVAVLTFFAVPFFDLWTNGSTPWNSHWRHITLH